MPQWRAMQVPYRAPSTTFEIHILISGVIRMPGTPRAQLPIPAFHGCNRPIEGDKFTTGQSSSSVLEIFFPSIEIKNGRQFTFPKKRNRAPKQPRLFASARIGWRRHILTRSLYITPCYLRTWFSQFRGATNGAYFSRVTTDLGQK